MGGWVYVGICAAGLIGWALLLDERLDSEHRIAAWWVAGVQGLGPCAGPVSFVRSTVALVVYSGVAWLGDLLASGAGNPLWALVVSGPAMLAYSPVVLAMAPFEGTAYAPWRSRLAAAGADARQQRAIAWWAGPPALVGFIAVLTTLFSVFVD